MTAHQNASEIEGTEKPIMVKASDLDYVNADWGQLTWYASEKQGNTNYLTLGRCIIYPQKANPRHYHPNCEEILIVIEGKISHTWKDDEQVVMTEGETITIPRGMYHQARNLGETNAVLMIAFTTPNRQTVGES